MSPTVCYSWGIYIQETHKSMFEANHEVIVVAALMIKDNNVYIKTSATTMVMGVNFGGVQCWRSICKVWSET